MNKILLFCSYLLLVLLFASCGGNKNISYFQDVNDVDKQKILSTIGYVKPTIQPGDILNIVVSTLDPEATVGINQPIVQPAIGNTSYLSIGNQHISGYIVDGDGNIHLNFVGKIKVQGLTLDESRKFIESQVAAHFKNPVVNVGFSNFKVSILGEVNKPGVVVFPQQKVNILDAIGLAGDLSIFGKRENVLIIRSNSSDPNDQLEFIRVNLNKSDFITSEGFWLKNGDIVYVEPSSGRIAANNTDKMQLVSIISSVTSSVALTITVILNLTK